MTLYELEVEITKIREAVNSIEVKGERNASLVIYSIKTCNDLIDSIHQMMEQANRQAAENNQNGSEAGEVNG